MEPNNWPRDADGDVMRRLASSGFDFEKEYEVDFNVDFDEWPPAGPAVSWLAENFENVFLHEPTDDSIGYVRIVVRGKVTYELVTSIQRRVSSELHQFGAVCDSWGVLHGSAA